MRTWSLVAAVHKVKHREVRGRVENRQEQGGEGNLRSHLVQSFKRSNLEVNEL